MTKTIGMKSMTLKRVIDNCCKKTGCKEQKTEVVFTSFLEEIIEELSHGNNVNLGNAKRRENTLNLLEYLTAKAGCMYLSSLRLPESRFDILHVLRGMPSPEPFTLTEWMEAVEYITGEKGTFGDKEQAKQYLIGYTSHNEEMTCMNAESKDFAEDNCTVH